MPHHLIIEAADLQKIIKQLQILEQQFELNTIEGLPPSLFLRSAIQPYEQAESIKSRVKTIILHIACDFRTQASQLSEKLDLKTHLLFSKEQYTLLFLKMNELVREQDPELRISIKEIRECRTVGDCVHLVERGSPKSGEVA